MSEECDKCNEQCLDCNCEIKSKVIEALEDLISSEDEYNYFNLLMDKINDLVSLSKFEERNERSLQILEKYEDYIKNIDKLNAMINEFKGLVAIVRGENQKLKGNISNGMDQCKR